MRRAQRRALLGNGTNKVSLRGHEDIWKRERGLWCELESDRVQDVDSKPLPAGSEIRLCKRTAVAWL